MSRWVATISATAVDDGVAAMLKDFSAKARNNIIRRTLHNLGTKVRDTAQKLAPLRKDPQKPGGQKKEKHKRLKASIFMSKFITQKRGTIYRRVLMPTRKFMGIDMKSPYYYPAFVEYGHIKYKRKHKEIFISMRDRNLSRMNFMDATRAANKEMKKQHFYSGKVPAKEYMQGAYDRHRNDLRPMMEQAIAKEVAKMNAKSARDTNRAPSKELMKERYRKLMVTRDFKMIGPGSAERYDKATRLLRKMSDRIYGPR